MTIAREVEPFAATRPARRRGEASAPHATRRAAPAAALALCLAALPTASSAWEGRLPASYELPGPCDTGGKSGKVRALLVGIDTYREVDAAGRPWFVPLAGSANDAHLLEQILERRAGAAPADVRLLIDAEANTDGFFSALNDLILASRCGDFVVFHFSGHTWRGALALADASVRGAGLVLEGELRRAVTALRNRGAFVLVHIDANVPEPLQLDVGRGARWRAAGGRNEAGVELAVDAGGFAGFYAGQFAFEQKVSVPRADGRQETRVYGLFSFATAAALGSAPLPSIRDLADRIRDGVAARARPGLAPAPVFEATEPDRPTFATGLGTRTGVAPRMSPAVAARIEISDPKRSRGVMVVTAPTVRVAGRVLPADGISGVVVHGTQARVLEGGRFEAQVELKPGPQTVYVVAVFQDHSMATESIELQGGSQPAPVTSRGRSYALVIGNADYRHIPKLGTPVADADAISRLLRERFGFETTVELDESRTLSLVLKNVGRREVFAALSHLRRRLGEEDSLLVFYAGHGDRPERATQAYWLPIDAEPDDHANWISADDIASEIALMNARHVLIVADSCFSGGLLRGASPAAPQGTSERARYLEEMTRRRSRHLMSSGGNEPVLDEGGGGHSVFANAFLNGLRAMADEVFTAQQLFSNRIQEPVAGKAGQTPQYGAMQKSGHDGGDFVFKRRAASAAGGGT